MTRDEKQKLYKSHAWRKLRAAALEKHPLCQECMRKKPPLFRQTEEIHHVNNFDSVRQFFCEPRFLVGLCKPCHSAKNFKRDKFNLEAAKAAKIEPHYL